MSSTTYTPPTPLSFATDASAAKSHGVSIKTGNIEWSVNDEPRRRVGVRLTTYNKGQSYALEVAYPKVYKRIGEVNRTGAGRNLGYQFYADGRPHHPHHEHGALAPAVERFVRSWLTGQVYQDEVSEQAAKVSAILPYPFKTEEAALDYVFTGTTGAVVAETNQGEYRYLVGFYDQEHAEELADVLPREHSTYIRRVKTYGKIDHRKVIDRLRDLGVTATLDADLTSVQIYVDNGNGALILDKFTGNLFVHHWDRTGGVAGETVLGQADSVTSAVEAIHRWYASYDLQQRAQSLLELLQVEVPGGVAHYAVEQAKTALRTLAREAFTVDFTYGRTYDA